MKYEVIFKLHLALIEKTLESVLPATQGQHPSVIHEAMRYSVFPGGKRFRAVLTLGACQAAGGELKEGAIAAAALELVHCYSLVHDDLPALDNDELRRGKPTCHKQFGEAMAILAGDGLLTLAFQILTQVKAPETAVKLIAELSTASGTYGMIGGQVADLLTTSGSVSLPMLDYINIHKTGKLIKASAVCGAIAAGADKETYGHLLKYGEFVGLAFQSVDDMQDNDGYVRLMPMSDIREKVRHLIAQAKKEIRPLGRKAKALQDLADFLLLQMPKSKRRGTHV